MKEIYFIPFILIIAFSGCCTKKLCMFPEEVSLGFHRYKPEDIDTLLITGYDRTSDFTKTEVPEHADSTTRYVEAFLSSSARDSTTRYYSLTTDYDWQVYIPATQQSFRFRNYVIKQEKCNDCFLRTDKHPALRGFNANGVQISGTLYEIYK